MSEPEAPPCPLFSAFSGNHLLSLCSRAAGVPPTLAPPQGAEDSSTRGPITEARRPPPRCPERGRRWLSVPSLLSQDGEDGSTGGGHTQHASTLARIKSRPVPAKEAAGPLLPSGLWGVTERGEDDIAAVAQPLSGVGLFCSPVDCSPPGSSVHGISQATMLEWGAISFSRGSSPPRDRTLVSCIYRWILYH